MATTTPTPLAMPKKRQLPEVPTRTTDSPPWQEYPLAKQAWVARSHPGVARLSPDRLAGKFVFLALELYSKLDPGTRRKTATVVAFEAAVKQLAESETRDGSWQTRQQRSLHYGKKRTAVALRWARRLLDDPYGIIGHHRFYHGGSSPIYAFEVLDVALEGFDEQETED